MNKIQTIAICALALLTGACASDEPQGGDAAVILTLMAPEALTRSGQAVGDASAIDRLEYVVYDISAGKSGLFDHGVISSGVTFPMDLNLQLITGHEYGILLWAASQSAPYSLSEEGVLTVNYSEVLANSETLDGFYAYRTLILNGNTQLDVEMKRPFAMVDIGASTLPEGDVQTSITVTDAPSGLNLLTGELTGKTTTAIFDYAPIPDVAYGVAGYSTLAYTYVLATAEPEYYSLTYSYKVGGASPVEKAVDNVALQANYRTNIYGSLPN